LQQKRSHDHDGEKQGTAHGPRGYPVPTERTTKTRSSVEKSTAGRTVMNFSSAAESGTTRDTVPMSTFGGYKLVATPGMRYPAVTTRSSGPTSVVVSTRPIRISCSPAPVSNPVLPVTSSRPATAESGSMINCTTDAFAETFTT